MDDFLGTSIQYSERQLLLLEEEHAANVQKTVEELIESGFLDSDYEDSTDSECDSIDTQNINSDIKQESNEQIFQLTDKPMSRNTNDLLITIEYILHKILNDIKTLIILFVLMITLPHIIQHNTNSNNNIYFGTHYRHHIYKCEYGYNNYNNAIYWLYENNNLECNNGLTFNVMHRSKKSKSNEMIKIVEKMLPNTYENTLIMSFVNVGIPAFINQNANIKQFKFITINRKLFI